MKKATSDLKNRLRKKTTEPQLEPDDFLSTGSTLLNLSISNNARRGFFKGGYVFIVGDSASGKTWLSLSCLAEAAINPSFDGYRFIRDDAEFGALMDVRHFFGDRVAERLETPTPSRTLEEFYYNVDDIVNDGRPFILVLDSMDVLSSESADDKFDERKKAARSGKETTGSYGDGKAKTNSEHLRRLMPILQDMRSILIIINQTRDNLGFGFEKKTRSGGRALRFYAGIEMWSSIVKTHYKPVRGVKMQTGIDCQVQLKKNRVTGQCGTVKFPIFHSMGIDDVGSCVDYLTFMKHWKKTAAGIVAPEFEFSGKRSGLIKLIENDDCERELQIITQAVWNEVRQETQTKRKSRYA